MLCVHAERKKQATGTYAVSIEVSDRRDAVSKTYLKNSVRRTSLVDSILINFGMFCMPRVFFFTEAVMVPALFMIYCLCPTINAAS